MKTRKAGFTLIELMIVVVIISILAAIGYPSYREYVKRAARAEAKTALLEDSQFMERNFTTANTYAFDETGENKIEDDDLPVQFTPKDGPVGAAKYFISVGSLTTSTFTLSAQPVAGGPMDDDECGTLTLDQTGKRDVTGTRSVAECWGR